MLMLGKSPPASKIQSSRVNCTRAEHSNLFILSCLPLRELEPLAGTLLTVLLSLFGSRISCEETTLPQTRTQFGVVKDECTCDAQLGSSSLAMNATTLGRHHHVELPRAFGENQRLFNLHAQHLGGKIILESLVINLNFPRTGP